MREFGSLGAPADSFASLNFPFLMIKQVEMPGILMLLAN